MRISDWSSDVCSSDLLGTIDEARLTALGPSVELEPQMALHMALVLHELGTNAAKYGALSTEEGRIDLNWTIQDGTLHLLWRDSGGPAVHPPSRRCFGSMLLSRVLHSDGVPDRKSVVGGKSL